MQSTLHLPTVGVQATGEVNGARARAPPKESRGPRSVGPPTCEAGVSVGATDAAAEELAEPAPLGCGAGGGGLLEDDAVDSLAVETVGIGSL